MIRWKDFTPDKTTTLNLFLLSLSSCLCVMTRMDTGLIFLPALVLMTLNAIRHTDRKRMIGALILGYAPFLIWELFSLVYYGFLLPNTFYAKMSHGIPKAEILAQGLFYLRNTINWDPLTLFAILGGIVLGFSRAFRNRFSMTVAGGAALYVLYVVWVGGDHMGGRFFTAPMLCCVIVLSTVSIHSYLKVLMVGVTILLGLTAQLPTLFNDFDESLCKLDPAKILYERGCCKPAFSLASRSREFQFRHNYRAIDGFEERAKGHHAIVEGMAGIIGFYAGPEVHIIDPLGLADPLLARLPMAPGEWRIAHFARSIPDGYREAVIDEGELKDPSLAEYYDRLKVIIRGRIWSTDRFREIWRFNTGAYNYLIQEYCRRQYKVKTCADLRSIRKQRRMQKVGADQQKRKKDRAEGR
jgi:arabinofuranosyltransferase